MSNKQHNNEPQMWIAFLMCVLGAVFYCYEYYLRVAPSVMGPELKLAYDLSEAGLGYLAAYYYWAYVPLQLPVGIAMDYWGPRVILTVACFCCSLGTYLFAGTNIVEVAKIGRFLVGFGSAFAYVGVLKLANIWLPRKFFAIMAGLCTTLGTLGAISGEIVMTKFSDIVGWKATLYSSAFVGFILTVLLWCFVRDKSNLVEPKTTYKSNLGHELLEVIKKPTLWLNGIIGCLLFLPLTVFAEMWAISFLTTAGIDKDLATFGSALVFLGVGMGGPCWGALSDVLRNRKILLVIGSITSAMIAFIIVRYTPNSLWLLNPLLFFCGFFASAQVLVFAIANDVCRKEVISTAVAFTNMLVMIGGLLIQPLVGLILDHLHLAKETQAEIAVDSMGDYQLALLVLPAGLLAAFFVSIILKNTYRSSGD